MWGIGDFMRRWWFTIVFVLLGAFLSYFGYLGLQGGCFSCAIPLLPALPVIRWLNWESAVSFYHSGWPADNFGVYKVVLIVTIEYGLLGWCIDLIRHRMRN